MPQHSRQDKLDALGRTLDILDTLRVRCPWDAKQTNDSLRPNTIEEVYELAAALMADDTPDITKELGDVLLHILFYAKIGDERGQFDIADVCEALNQKLIYRHPHIYGNVHVDDAHQVEQNWEQLKLRERGSSHRTLAGVPEALPALIKAYRIQEKAANVGFDWERPEQVWDKVAEELSEVKEALTQRPISPNSPNSHNPHDLEGEIGDLIFSIVNAARLYGINPENALERTNRKFIHRFNHIEETALAQGRDLKDMTLQEMDALWNEAKL